MSANPVVAGPVDTATATSDTGLIDDLVGLSTAIARATGSTPPSTVSPLSWTASPPPSTPSGHSSPGASAGSSTTSIPSSPGDAITTYLGKNHRVSQAVHAVDVASNARVVRQARVSEGGRRMKLYGEGGPWTRERDSALTMTANGWPG